MAGGITLQAPPPTFSPGGTQAICGKCGAKQPGGKFCAECGAPLVVQKKFCSGCGIELAANAKFCSGCGTPAIAAPPAG
jgi:predicted amidophosphoribosyltransferase